MLLNTRMFLIVIVIAMATGGCGKTMTDQERIAGMELEKRMQYANFLRAKAECQAQAFETIGLPDRQRIIEVCFMDLRVHAMEMRHAIVDLDKRIAEIRSKSDSYLSTDPGAGVDLFDQYDSTTAIPGVIQAPATPPAPPPVPTPVYVTPAQQPADAAAPPANYNYVPTQPTADAAAPPAR